MLCEFSTISSTQSSAYFGISRVKGNHIDILILLNKKYATCLRCKKGTGYLHKKMLETGEVLDFMKWKVDEAMQAAVLEHSSVGW